MLKDYNLTKKQVGTILCKVVEELPDSDVEGIVCNILEARMPELMQSIKDNKGVMDTLDKYAYKSHHNYLKLSEAGIDAALENYGIGCVDVLSYRQLVFIKKIGRLSPIVTLTVRGYSFTVYAYSQDWVFGAQNTNSGSDRMVYDMYHRLAVRTKTESGTLHYYFDLEGVNFDISSLFNEDYVAEKLVVVAIPAAWIKIHEEDEPYRVALPGGPTISIPCTSLRSAASRIEGTRYFYDVAVPENLARTIKAACTKAGF